MSERVDDVLLTVREVAARLRVSDESVYRLVRSNKLRAVRIGELWRIPQSAVHDLVNQSADTKRREE